MNCVKCGTMADCTDGSGQWWCKSDFPYIPKPQIAEVESTKTNTCNRHSDCASADRRAKLNGYYYGAGHCRDACCDDCFGN